MDSQTQPEVPKTERKVVIARYWVDEAFKVPDGIDLENKKQVKDWGVKWNTLYIYMVDGTTIKVEGVGWMENSWRGLEGLQGEPQLRFIEDASEFQMIHYTDDEDDEED